MPAEALPIAGPTLLTAALPGDITTCTIDFGTYADVAGTPLATLAGRLYPVDPHNGRRVRLVNTTTGHVLLPSDIPITITAGVGSVGPIPHTDNASLAPAGFAYRVEWDLPSSKPSPGNRTFLLPASVGDTVDYDLLIEPDKLSGGLSFPGVYSINGQTGDAILDAADVGAQPAGDYATTSALTGGLAAKADTADLAAVATTGTYADLDGKPDLDAIMAALLNDPTSATYARVVALIDERTGFGRGA